MKKRISLLILLLLFSTSSFAENYKFPNYMAVSPSSTTTFNSGIVVDTTNSEAFLLRKNDDSGDVFGINSVTNQLLYSTTGSFANTVILGSTVTPDFSMVSNGVTRIYELSYSDTASTGPNNYMMRARGTQSSPTIISNNDRIGLLGAAGWDGSSFRNSSAIMFNSDGTPGTSDMPGRISFYTTPDGSSSVAETLRINNLGNLSQLKGKSSLALASQGVATNCAIDIAGTTLTIKGDGTYNGDSTDLSSSSSNYNPCSVYIEGNTSGTGTVARFTSNVTATFGSASQTSGNLFGLIDQNYAQVMPIFLGVIADPTIGSTSHKFVISRVRIAQSGTTGELCQLSETSCDGQNDVMILGTGLSLSAFQSQPITWVGWFGGTYATSGGAWTFIEATTVGFNDNWKREDFIASTYFLANGGTAPVFSINTVHYRMDDNGIYYDFYYNGDGGTDGAGAVQAQIEGPYRYVGGGFTVCGTGVCAGATTISGEAGCYFKMGSGSHNISISYQSAAATSASITNAMFSNGGRYVGGQCRYKVWE